MKVLSLEAPRALEETIAVVQAGGIVAFPTDTVYGIGASLKYPETLDRIYALKHRPTERTMPILVSSLERLEAVAERPEPRVLALLRHFWPGPLTAVLPAKPGLPPHVVAPDGSVGVRIPNHSLALTLTERAGGALATTSANRSGEAPACRAEDIAEQLPEGIDIVLKGGYTPCGLPSTVIRFDDARIAVIRAGAIASGEIERIWDRILQADSSTPAR